MKKIYYLLLICILAIQTSNAQDSVTVTFRLQSYLPNGQEFTPIDSLDPFDIYGNFEDLNSTTINGQGLTNTYPVNYSSPNIMSFTDIPNLFEIKVRFPSSSIGQELIFSFMMVTFGEDSTFYNNPDFINCVISIEAMSSIDPNFGLYSNIGNMLRSIIIPPSDTTFQYCWSSCLQCDGSLPSVNSPSTYLTGRVFIDLNQDAILNEGEPRVSQASVDLMNSQDTITSLTGLYGHYGFLAYPDSYTIHFIPPSIYTTTFLDQTITIGNIENIDSLDIPLQLLPDYYEIRPLFDVWPTVIGCEQISLIQIQNQGNTVSNLSCILTLPEGVNFISSTPEPSNINGNIYTYLISNSAILSIDSILISTSIPPPPTFLPGDILTWNVNLSTVPNELNPNNNIITYNTTVLGAYDPNDKVMLKGDYLTPTQVNNGETFHYRIRFQNTGNYPARFIHVRDTLEAGLNPATIKVLSSSHDCSLQISNERDLDFYFPNIQLPDSTSNPEGSQGYIIFEVQPYLPVEEGDIIQNTAHIYFDFNPAVITNTNIVRIETPEGILKWNATATDAPWFDANGNIHWKQNNWEHLAIYSIDGRLIQSEKILGTSSSIQLKNAGIYLLQFSHAGQSKYYKVIR